VKKTTALIPPAEQKNNQLTIVIHIYNNQKLLDLQIESWDKWGPISNLELIFIDDGSRPALNLSTIPIWVRKIRILEDIPWNQPGAKNLGAHLASSPWLLFFDADQFIDKNKIIKLIALLPKLDKKVIYRFPRICSRTNQKLDIHQNSQLISRQEYTNFGGYDEDFSGNYGHEDAYLERLWKFQGGRISVLDEPSLIDLSELRTTGLNRNDRINELLRRRKMRFWHLLQNPVGKYLLSNQLITKGLIKFRIIADGRPSKKIKFNWQEI